MYGNRRYSTRKSRKSVNSTGNSDKVVPKSPVNVNPRASTSREEIPLHVQSPLPTLTATQRKRKEKLLAQRESILSRAVSLQSHFERFGDRMLLSELNVRLQVLENSFAEFTTIQSELEVLTSFDPDITEAYIAGVDAYCILKASMQSRIDADSVPSPGNKAPKAEIPLPSIRSISVKLPKIDLPKFSGKQSDWLNFSHSFQILINSNTSLGETQKFLYLRSCLTGVAAQSIEALEIVDQNYSLALETLEQRFGNRRLVVNSHFDELFKLSAVTKPTPASFTKLISAFEAHQRAISSLATDKEFLESILVHLLSSKLDSETIEKWESSRTDGNLPSFKSFMDFLVRRSQTLENLSLHTRISQPLSSKKSTALVVGAQLETKNTCALCKSESHSISRCDKFKAMDSRARYAEAKNSKLCINCLSSNHMLKDCKSSYRCRTCSQTHHTMLHHDTDNVRSTSRMNPRPSAPSASSLPTTSDPALSCQPAPTCKHYLFGTALVFATNAAGNLVPCRALIDSAAGPNFVTESLAKALRLPLTLQETGVTGIGGSRSQIKSKVQTTIHSRISQFSIELEFAVIQKITVPLPQVSLDVRTWKIPQRLRLADPEFHKSAEIDILIGVEPFLDLIREGKMSLGPNLPKLQDSMFGWLVMGTYTESFEPALIALNSVDIPVEDSTNALLQKFWELEQVDPPKSSLTIDETFCEEQFASTTSRDQTGRFTVKLPFVRSPELLGESYDKTIRQFLSLEKRLTRHPELKSQYIEFMEDFIKLGHMEKLEISQMSPRHYFMPHHSVTNDASTTTRLRVVFNASSPTTSGESLNSLLPPGPQLQDGLFANLIRFRLPRFAVCSDITKMYRQVKLNPSDQDFQLIFWRMSPHDQLSIYRINRVIYGVTPAGYLAMKCLKELAVEHAQELPLASRALLKNFYVDNMLGGEDTLELALKLKSEIVEILLRGGFALRKWCSNSSEVISSIPVEDHEPFVQLEDKNVVKTLGIIWHPDSDSFKFHHTPPPAYAYHTKRTVCRDIAKIYDPLGLISPLVVRLKMFLQHLWTLKLEWDESLPANEAQIWNSYLHDISRVIEISIPRLALNPVGHRSGIQLHGFSDASGSGFGACIYLRTSVYGEEPTVRLLCAKARVAPLQPVSIPRLELCGLLLLAELVSSCLSHLDLKLESVNLWTDSTIVLAWLQHAPKTLSVYVANRVGKIQELSQGWNFRHVPSEHNPADLNSRGTSLQDLICSSLWFEGPIFLKFETENWPQIPNFSVIEVPEMRNTNLALVVQDSPSLDDYLQSSKFSNSFCRIRRIFAYILRFISNCRRRKADRFVGALFSHEMHSSEIAIMIAIQSSHFAEDRQKMLNKKPLSSNSKLICLSPFLDSHNVLRVGGRLKNAPIPFEEKHPILLPNKHTFVRSLILNSHLQYYHLGPNSLLAVIRQRYWILNGKSTVAAAVHNCVYCKRRAARTLAPLMGHLPADRVDSSSPSVFRVVGVDHAGPFDATLGLRGRASFKIYMVLFICFQSKAVHIEASTDLTSEGFLRALKIFIATRGKPEKLMSDNSGTFIGARNLLEKDVAAAEDKAQSTEILNYLREHAIQWKTVPARSPHMAGIWESSIKIAKRHISAAIHKSGTSIMNLEDLRVIFKEVEAIVNSRPIAPLSDDPNDMTALTPAHLLIGRPLLAAPEPSIESDDPMEITNRFQRIQAIRQYFWQRWSRDYLQSLQRKPKWSTCQPNLQEGTLVSVKDDNLPPLKWALGRIQKLHPGNDGITRVATIRMGNSTLKRAVHNLVPLLPDVSRRAIWTRCVDENPTDNSNEAFTTAV